MKILDENRLRNELTIEEMEYGVSLFTDYDIFLFRQGQHRRLYEKLGSHPMNHDAVSGTHFAVWAPNAKAVSVVGDFN